MDKRPSEKILKRIQQLLAMANDVSSPNEAAIAARRAEALMREYQLSQVDVMLKDLDNNDVEVSVVDAVQAIYGQKYKSTGTPKKWVRYVAVGVAKMNECEVDRDTNMFRFWGVSGDQVVAAETFKYLIHTINRLATKYPGNRAEKGQFRKGCAYVIQLRCNEIAAERKRDFEATISGKDLIVLKQALIQRSADREFGYTKSKITVDPSYEDGCRAGRTISLNRQVSEQKQGKLS